MNPASAIEPVASIRDAARRFLELFARDDVRGIAACYTDDAQILAAGLSPIRGRAAIESVFKFTGGKGHTLEFDTEELEVHAGTAIEIGAYARRHGDGSLAERGRYMIIWKRVAEAWKIHRDMFTRQTR
jgi:ketosteroid isomerase-like protein